MSGGLQRRHLLGAAAMSILSHDGVRAQERFPQRPVRMVVPYSVGVGPDVVARSVAVKLSQRWNQTVWVDNKPGASGIVAQPAKTPIPASRISRKRYANIHRLLPVGECLVRKIACRRQQRRVRRAGNAPVQP